MLCYLIVAASFFVHVDPKSGELPGVYCIVSQKLITRKSIDEFPLFLCA